MSLACKEEDVKTSSKDDEFECAVCLQTCVHPVQLPCSHIFCYLCVKGVANQSKRCAMCRQEIPSHFLDHPLLLKKLEEKESEADGYEWFYEGRNGWWQYDERTSIELETSYANGSRLCEVLVAGFLYTIDFDRMIQNRRNDPSRRRRIKRDLSCIPKKGVAGLKSERSELELDNSAQQQVQGTSSSATTDIDRNDDNSIITSSTDSNGTTPQVDHSSETETESTNSEISSSISNLANHLHNMDISSFSRTRYGNTRRHLRPRPINTPALPDSSTNVISGNSDDNVDSLAAAPSDLSSNVATRHSDSRIINPALISSSSDLTSSVSSSTTSVVNDSVVGGISALGASTCGDGVEIEGSGVQYYSLDDTEEYHLDEL